MAVAPYSLRQLADELAELRRNQQAIRMPGLAFSSFPTGYGNSIDQVDEATGNPVMQVGEAFDGGHGALALVDPPLPTPSAAVVTGLSGTIVVSYDGTFLGADGATDITIPTPTYWTKTEVHASTDPAFTAEFWDTLKDTFTSPRGGEKSIAVEPGTYYVRLVARGAAGGRSAASAAVAVTVTATITQAELDAMQADFDADMLALSGALARKPGPLSGTAIPSTAPAVRAPKGATYFRLDGTGGVIGNYEQTEDEGDGIGDTWVLRPFRSDVITSLDVGKLSAATANITTGVADKFFANIFATRRLSAQHVYIGAGPNPIPDPAFLDATTLAARKARSTGGTAAWTDVAATATSPKGVRRTSTTGGVLFDLWPLPTAVAADIPGMIPVEAGDTWKLQVDVETSVTASCYFMVRQGWADNTFSTVQILPNSGSNAIGRRTLVGEYKVPSGVVAITPIVNTSSSTTVFTVYGNAFMGLKSDGTLVVDGLINGQTVLGARVATADTGARIEMNGLGGNTRFFGVNTAGETYMDFSAAGAFLKAAFEVDAPLFAQKVVLGPFVIPLSPTNSQDAAGLAFFKNVEPVGEAPPMATSYDGDNFVIEGRRTATSLPGKIYVGPDLSIYMEGNLDVQGNVVATGNLGGYDVNAGRQVNTPNVVSGRTLLGYDGTITGAADNAGTGYYVISARGFPGFYFRNDGTAGIERPEDAAIWNPINSGALILRGAIRNGVRNEVRIDSGSKLEYYDPPTSTFGANVGISNSPKDRLYKLTSSGTRKINQQLIADERAWLLLGIEPTTWVDRTQLEETHPDIAAQVDYTDPIRPKLDPALLAGLDLPRIPGLVANQVHAAGLTEYVTYDADGQPEAVDYDRMWTLIIPILRYILEKVGYPGTTKVPIKPSPWKPAAPIAPRVPKNPTSPKGKK